jgi:hypothetical protein
VNFGHRQSDNAECAVKELPVTTPIP